jgi:hypothetical protein
MRVLLLASVLVLACGSALAAGDRFYVYNSTTTTDLTGIYLAPAGTGQWGPNQVLNDNDKTLDHSERLRLRGIARGRYDVKVTFGEGRTCIKRNVDLTQDLTFEIRDADLAGCR